MNLPNKLTLFRVFSFVNVYITEAMEYDLIGDVVDELAE